MSLDEEPSERKVRDNNRNSVDRNMIKDAYNYVENGVKNVGQATLRGLAAVVLGCLSVLPGCDCNPVVPPIDPPVDITAPTITYTGPSEIVKPLGDAIPSIVEYIAVSDDTDPNPTYTISEPDFDSDGDGREEIADGFYEITGRDASGNESVLLVPARTAYESGGLENFLNTPTIMEDGLGGYLTVKQAAESLGHYRHQGTNPVNIEGEYLSSGDWINSLGSGTSFSDVYSAFSNQSELNVDVVRGSYDYPNSIITGNGDNFSVYFFQDIGDDGTNDRAYIYVAKKLPSGVLESDTLALFVDEAKSFGRDWIKYDEEYVPN